jgi:alkylated DNA repair dioxygenase AlkB
MAADLADDLLAVFMRDTPWQEETGRTRAGKPWTAGRRTYAYGDEGVTYFYAGKERPVALWEPSLWNLRAEVEDALRINFNYALLNLYRDGRDHIGMHSDDTRRLAHTTIASISLGAARDFVLQHKREKKTRYSVSLAHGSLLVMSGDTQSRYKHGVPARAKVTTPRINITFRSVRTADT